MHLSPTACSALLLGLATWAAAAEPAPDPLAASRQMDVELEQLRETPIGKQEDALVAAMELARQAYEKDMEVLRAKDREMRAGDAYAEYRKKREEIQVRRNSAWEIERKAMSEAAQKIYADRHAELRVLKERNATPPLTGLDLLNHPRLDGSTSTHPLSVMIASRILGVDHEWLYPPVEGHSWNRPRLPDDLFLPDGDSRRGYDRDEDYDFNLAASRVVAKPRQAGQERVAMLINSLLAANSSTHNAFVNLVEGKSDISLTARAPSADELGLAEKRGVAIALQPIARDALVFIVNQKNPVRSITREQVRGIYEGTITDWSGLGGNGAITALWRERNSGSRELFDAIIGKGRPIPEPDQKQYKRLFAFTMAGPYNRVTQEPACLGYSVHYYEHFMALSPYTRTLAIDGVEPGAATIADGTYPYVAEVFVAYRAGDPETSPARRLVDWLVSPAGQAVVRESGYVPAK